MNNYVETIVGTVVASMLAWFTVQTRAKDKLCKEMMTTLSQEKEKSENRLIELIKEGQERERRLEERLNKLDKTLEERDRLVEERNKDLKDCHARYQELVLKTLCK